MNRSALDDVIRRLLEVRRSRPGKQQQQQQVQQLGEGEIRQLCAASKDVFMRQPNLLELDAPIKIAGDIHGQYPDLLRLLDLCGYPPQHKYLFLGDYVDRGSRSVETTCLLLAYKVRHPDAVFLLRGNHECESVNCSPCGHGFLGECTRRGLKEALWKTINGCFHCLPLAALVGGKVFCVHGGLSPELESMDQIRRVRRPLPLVPDEGLVCDLLWSDPDAADEWGWGESARGRSFAFGSDVVAEFVEKHGLRMVCRAHEVKQGGYEWFADGKLVTVFSAPDYAGRCDNAGAVMTVHGDLNCSFHILQPTPLTVLADAADEHA